MARAVRKMTEELVQASINFGYWWGHMGATPRPGFVRFWTFLLERGTDSAR
jgi:hypothetical protein